MSDTVVPPPETEAGPAPAITPDELAPQIRKHVDPKAPVPLRGMGAKLLVPMSPHDAACVLYLLSFDPDPGIREQALKSAAAFPEKIALPALKDDTVPAPVLGWFAERLSAAGNDKLLESLVLNPATPDEAMVVIVRAAAPQTCELVSQNQLRLLRHEPLLRALLAESRATPATIDSTADFAIRSGIYLSDVPALVAAHKRIHGDAPPEAPAVTADAVLSEFKKELADERPEGEELGEDEKLTLTQRIQRMNVAEKIKLATRGNKEARGLLLRDSNKLVAVAAVHSPRITDGEIVQLTFSRTIMDDVLRTIMMNRDWMKIYQVKHNLVKNPKTPLPSALKLIQYIRVSDLKDLMKNKNVPTAVQTAARNQLAKMTPK